MGKLRNAAACLAISFCISPRYNALLAFQPERYERLPGAHPMNTPSLRLGDVIDDYCPRCKLLLNHAVASMVDGNVVKVICQTCHSEHPYKNAVVPPKKRSGPKAALLDQVLAKAAPAAATSAPPAQAAAAEEAPEPRKKKRASAPARYISRHATRPPRTQR